MCTANVAGTIANQLQVRIDGNGQSLANAVRTWPQMHHRPLPFQRGSAVDRRLYGGAIRPQRHVEYLTSERWRSGGHDRSRRIQSRAGDNVIVRVEDVALHCVGVRNGIGVPDRYQARCKLRGVCFRDGDDRPSLPRSRSNGVVEHEYRTRIAELNGGRLRVQDGVLLERQRDRKPVF